MKPTQGILFLVIAVTVTCIAVRYSFGISGNDFWWHIKAGEWILENHAIPKVGIFSWYAMDNNLEWVSHEWLSEVLLYLVYSILGSIGILLLSF